MKSKRSSHSFDNKGFSLLELLVTVTLGAILVSMCLSAAMVHKNTLGRDTVRTRMNQNVRGAFDIMGLDIREAGENLVSSFPAVELTDGASGQPDTLTVRRSLVYESAPVCTAIAGGSTGTTVDFAIPGTTAGCTYSGQTPTYTAWNQYLQSHNNNIKVFIYDRGSKVGEWFNVRGLNNTGTGYALVRPSGAWKYSYSVNSASVYIVEQWMYRLSNGLLQVIKQDDTTNPLNVAFNITNFQVGIRMQDGTVKTSFTRNDVWTNVKSIEVSLSGREQYASSELTRTVTTRFFPRNILSN